MGSEMCIRDSAALRTWGAHPDAYYAILYPEAIGWVDAGGAPAPAP